MQITRQRPDSRRAPEENFTGQVWVDEIAVSPPPGRTRAFSVHFNPGARTAWHTHPAGQILHVIDGTARVQREGGPVETLTAGETVRFEPGESHWHGAAPTSFMTHFVVQDCDETGIDAHWGPHVTDDEYDDPSA